jgi:hypothetical protein
MPSRKLVHPGSNKNDRGNEPHSQSTFNDVFEDEPASEVPDGALAKAINCHCQGGSVWPRYGSQLYTQDKFPAIPGRTGYTAHKVGNTLISDSGDIFLRDDVSNIWIWPNGLADEITGYISPTQMTVRDSDTNIGAGCYIQGKINLWQWHRLKEIWVLQLADDFWTANRELTTFTQVLIVSRDKPSNSFSEWIEDEENCIVENQGGQFKIILTDSPPTVYRTNSDIPTIKITSNQDDGEKNHKYRYFYGLNRLESATNFVDRNTPIKILTESGLNEYKYIDTDKGDWSIINTDKPVGKGVNVYGILMGGAGVVTNPYHYQQQHDYTIRVNINNLGYANIICDFASIMNMDDVAAVLQTSIRRYFPSATVDYVVEGTYPNQVPRIKITSGKLYPGSITYCLPGIGGNTTLAANLYLLSTSVGVELSTEIVDIGNTVRGLNVPWVGSSGERQWHWTHYPVYRTADLGPEGKSIKASGKASVNSPEFISWIKDLRVCAAFIARRQNGYVELYPTEAGGEFEKADEGSVVEFEDGVRVTLLEEGYLNNKNCAYSTTPYYDGSSQWQAAMIGDGRVARMVKTGTILTRYPGSVGTSFSDADIRKPVWFPNGTVSYIKRVISVDSFEVWDDRDWSDTGITLDPTTRNFRDTIDDEKLFGYSAGWTCKSRFMRPTRIADMISKQPGFILNAPRYGKMVSYMQFELGYRQFVGYHNWEYQRVIVEDQIMALEDFPNRFSVICKGIIYTGVTNNAIELTLPGTLQKIFLLSDPEKVADFGISDAGAIQRIGDGLLRMITNQYEVRDFDGINYGEDLSVSVELNLKKFKKAVMEAYHQFCSIYSKITGYIWWWRAYP